MVVGRKDSEDRPSGNLVALRRATRVGRYEIVRTLGQGGFGITYLARDAQLQREVAIKEYLPSALAVRVGPTELMPRSAETAEDFHAGLDRFTAEGRTLARLANAPAIVRVHDFLECYGTAYLVMELLQGETLEHRLHHAGKLNARAADTLFWPLLDGLERVHSAGFLHRDIKPANILVDGEGRPTLIDFGASRAAVIGHSVAMTAVFTPGYAAIEQFTSSIQGPWTDIYGLSATIHHAIRGSPPPTAVARVVEDSYLPLSRQRPAGFTSSFLAGVDAGLAVRSSDRPQSIEQWRGRFQPPAVDPATAVTVVMPKSVDDVSPTRSATTSRGRARVVIMTLVVGLLGLAAAGAIGYAMIMSQRSSQMAVLGGLQVHELEQALIQKRQAEADAAAKQQAEDESKRQAAAEAQRQAQEAAKRKAEAEAAAKQQAEDESKRQAAAEAQRQAQEAAKRKAEAEAAAKQQAEDEAKRQAAVEAQRQAQEAAKRKAEAEAAARAGEADAKKAAEAAEAGLRLSQRDRQRLQVALTSLGFDTRGADGVFGPRSREMIAAWQRSRALPSTSYLAAAQQQALLREAAPAITRYEDEQKKLEEQKKAEEEAKIRAAATTPQSFDGHWRRDRTARCTSGADGVSFNGILVRDGKFSYTSVGRHHDETCHVQVSADGSFQNHGCLLQLEGRFVGDLLQLNYLSPSYGACSVTARRGQ